MTEADNQYRLEHSVGEPNISGCAGINWEYKRTGKRTGVMKVVDMHCDTIGEIHERQKKGENISLRESSLHIDLNN